MAHTYDLYIPIMVTSRTPNSTEQNIEKVVRISLTANNPDEAVGKITKSLQTAVSMFIK